jgi:two-component system LytT family response regulator
MKSIKLRCVLLDDERHSLETLNWLIDEYCPSIEVIDAFSDPYEAMKSLRKSPPDLLFVDIAMPGINGFDLVCQLFPLSFSVIFVTAHNGPIIQALKKADILFLLKPVDDKELNDIVDRALNINQRVSPEQINSFRMAVQNDQ